ncbi:uncharacterized protein [Symphalangus syndactylus]|uniref:uncharacterized protein n=1 Tax=Symphalangus syndactylus TaxID=9590 RepID=UPI003005E713
MSVSPSVTDGAVSVYARGISGLTSLSSRPLHPPVSPTFNSAVGGPHAYHGRLHNVTFHLFRLPSMLLRSRLDCRPLGPEAEVGGGLLGGAAVCAGALRRGVPLHECRAAAPAVREPGFAPPSHPSPPPPHPRAPGARSGPRGLVLRRGAGPSSRQSPAPPPRWRRSWAARPSRW